MDIIRKVVAFNYGKNFKLVETIKYTFKIMENEARSYRNRYTFQEN